MPASLLVRLLLWLWLGSAVAAGHFHVLHRLPPAALPALIVALAALAVMVGFRVPPLRAWLGELDLRSLVILHLARFFGIYLMLLHHRGMLPREFAMPAGIGGVIVATLAIPVIFAPVREPLRLRIISIWNVVGFMDILFATAAIIRLNMAAPLQLLPLYQLPLCLVPTFLMPAFLATHVIIHVRVSRDQGNPNH